MSEFDAYLMVDWSASSRPVTEPTVFGTACLNEPVRAFSVMPPKNPATRRRALAEINDNLRGLARRERMVLVGFDFPYGYPAGFADALMRSD